MKIKNKPILVTGSHRSGSTWVGQMLSLAQGVKYVSEPFNPGYGLKIFKSWFIYINDKNEVKYFQPIKNLLKFKGNYRFNLPAWRYWSNNLWPFNKRPLIKDPIACFSAQWLADNFDMDVIVLFRHPVAFYTSLKRLNWHFDFSNFLDQGDLMADHLNPFFDLIMKENKSYAEEAAILWLCIYYVLDKYIAKNSNWIVKRHEDISLNPINEFKDIYNQLGLNFTNKIKKEIIKYSSGKSSEPIKVLDLKRDSQSVVRQWLGQTSEEEIATIKNITGALANKYYPESEWH
ncbi:MAG: sulfotransferase [Patescibacteria group bacterium]